MATYLQTVDQSPWIPDRWKPRNNGRQQQFLLLADIMEVFYGGAAGGGKTVANLIAAAQFVHVPGYSALLLRENFADLGQPGAWGPLSKAWWLNSPARWSATEHRWTFPSGATITFGYLERDDSVYQYDSAAFQFVGIDELTQHSEWRYKFMFGRIRRPLDGPLSTVPLRMRSASNPGNKGHEWVRNRFLNPATREPGAVFVPAKLDDNKGNMDVEAYRRDSLSKLDPVTRRQREEGDWETFEGGRFQRAWFKPRWFWHGDDFVVGVGRIVRRKDLRIFLTVDPAASAEEAEGEDRDYTAVSVWALTPRNELLWLEMEKFRAEVPDIVPRVERLYRKWAASFVGIEGGGTQKGVYQLARRTRMAVRELTPGGKDKLVRATEAIVLCESGRVYLPVAAAWIEEALSEVVRFTGTKKDAHDDVVDTLAYAAMILTGAQGSEHRGFVPRVVGG